MISFIIHSRINSGCGVTIFPRYLPRRLGQLVRSVAAVLLSFLKETCIGLKPLMSLGGTAK